MSKYIETVYDVEKRPMTDYPKKLVNYLIHRFHIPDNAKLLDNGCGRADFSFAFYEEGLQVSACDISQDIPKIMEKMNKGCFFGGVNLETDRLPFSDNFFDVVFTKSVLEHIHKPENFLGECKRVLKPNGLLIVMVPDWYSTQYIFYDDFTHVQPYTPNGVKDALTIFGLSDVSSDHFYQLPIVWKYPFIKCICKLLQLLGPVKKTYRNKFFRFSRELMILATGRKTKGG